MTEVWGCGWISSLAVVLNLLVVKCECDLICQTNQKESHTEHSCQRLEIYTVTQMNVILQTLMIPQRQLCAKNNPLQALLHTCTSLSCCFSMPLCSNHHYNTCFEVCSVIKWQVLGAALAKHTETALCWLLSFFVVAFGCLGSAASA